MTKTVKTETVVREINAAGQVIKETTTVVTVDAQPDADQKTGMYM